MWSGADVMPGRPEPRGAHVRDGGVNVAVHSPEASRVQVLLEHDGVESLVDLPGWTAGVWHGFIPAVQPGTRYGLRVHGPWEPHRGARFNPHKLLIDPYARAIDGQLEHHPATRGHIAGDDLLRDDSDSAPYVPRAVVVADAPQGWDVPQRSRRPLADHVIYEMHVRGFTQRHPGIPEHLRGTYAGVAHPAALDHLVRLGVTAVELLPIHHHVAETHLKELGLTNYWGYNTLGFFAPHAGYSASGSQGQQVSEFRAMVRALHEVGISIILDVVYNHTAEEGLGGPTLSLRGLNNVDCYHLTDHGRQYVNHTACGNAVNASTPGTLRLILDSLRYWVTMMGVDGFRFDLAPTLTRVGERGDDVDMHGPFMAAVAQDPVLRDVLLIAEPWDLGPHGYQLTKWPSPWAEWNDRFRDTARDLWRGQLSALPEMAWRMGGSADLFASSGRGPASSINYVTAHDGFTLHDLVAYAHKHNEANGEDNHDGSDENRSTNHGHEGPTDNPHILAARRRHIRNLLTTLLLSSGTPMLLGGDEFGRTQHGNNNAYCQDNAISWFDWDLEPWQHQLIEFTRELIALRHACATLRPHTWDAEPGSHAHAVWLDAEGQALPDSAWSTHEYIPTTVQWLLPASRRRHPETAATDAPDVLIIMNLGDQPTRVTLPDQPAGHLLQRRIDTAHDGSASQDRFTGGQIHVVEGHSIVVFVSVLA